MMIEILKSGKYWAECALGNKSVWGIGVAPFKPSEEQYETIFWMGVVENSSYCRIVSEPVQ